MEIALLIIGLIGIIPAIYFIYERFIRKPHSIDFHVGNVILARIVSPNKNRDEKLALILCSLTFTNKDPKPVTLKEVILSYRFAGKKEQADLTSIPIGIVEGVESIALTNGINNIIVAWTNLREMLKRDRVLQHGEVLRGSAVFLLNVPIPQLREISDYVLMIRDYSGGRSAHRLFPEPSWYQGNDKGFSLVDAPVSKRGNEIYWEGTSLTTQKPA